jgi:hypothetical protein
MARKIPWLRVAVEGSTIVSSILLAFGIQAWWEGRQREEARRDLLVTMLESVRLNVASLATNLQGLEADQALVSTFFALPPSALAAVPTDSALTFFTALARPSTRQAAQGPLSRSLDGNRLSLIEDLQLLGKLDEWLVRWAELEERAGNLAAAELQVVDALGNHRAFQNRNLVGQREMPTSFDLRPIQDDRAVLRSATTMKFERYVYAIFVGRTQETLLALEDLLVSALE